MVQHDDFKSNFYGVSRENPYEGLFIRDSKFFRYTINHTKKEYFDIEKTQLYENAEGRLIAINPLPLLMSFYGPYDAPGLWLGDDIEVSNDPPSAEYKDKSYEYSLD